MLEPHPQQHSPNNWRDILTHLAIVTVGLFIALSLEAGVEALHHRHLMHETRHNLEHEFEINKKYLDTDIKSYRGRRNMLKHNIELLLLIKHDPAAKLPEGKAGQLVWLAGWEPLTDTQWRAAYQTTGIALMPRTEVAEWAESYHEADELNTALSIAGHHVFALGGYQHVDADPHHLTPAQIDTLLSGTGVALSEFQVVGFELLNWAQSNHVPTDLTREEVLAQ